jgi:HTH-type transcriptional regulator/antitoxin HigA
MKILPIKNEVQYEKMLGRINELMDAQAETPEADELELLSLLVDAYEEARFSIGDPDPIEYLKNVMEFQGLEQKDLARLLNSRSRASEVLNRQRHLTLAMVRQICSAWSVPADPLIRKYALVSGQ